MTFRARGRANRRISTGPWPEGGLRGALRVVDAGCGPGADLALLAERLPDARLEGIDRQAHFVAAARARVSAFGDRVTVRQGDMGQIEGPVDFIWCAGALYFLGVTEGLTAWRPALAKGGHVCFSEPVWVDADPPQVARDFWADYPDITDMEGIADRVTAGGFRVIAARLLQPSAWAGYYLPMSARIAALRPGAGPGLSKVLDAAAREIAQWRAAPDHITYAQLLVAPR